MREELLDVDALALKFNSNQQPVPIPLWIPTLTSAAMIVVMLLVALWRFEREEF